MPWYALTSGSVTAITMRNDAVFAFDEKNFQPLMTHSSPSLTARVLNMRRVGPGVRLGHRVAREHLAVEQRPQVALLLLGRAVVGDDLGVAGVGRLAPEHDRRPLRATEDLVQQRELQLAVALPAELGPEVRGPQPLAAHLVLQRVDRLAPVLVERDELQVREHEVERLDLLPHERRRPSPAAPGTRGRSRNPMPWCLHDRALGLGSRWSTARGVRASAHAYASSPGQNRILGVTNTIPDPEDVADRVARQTLAGREAAYATEVRRLLDAALDVMRRCGTTVATPGRRHRGRRRALQRGVLPPLPVEGRARRRHPRRRRRSGCAATSRTRSRRSATPEGQVRRWVEGVLVAGRRRHRGDDPGGPLERRQRRRPGRRRAGTSPAAPWRRSCTQPFAALGSTDPELDAALAAHATFGKLSDYLWQGTQPSPAEIDHIVDFCLDAITPRS